MQLNFSGKVAVVTGGTRGIGAAIVSQLNRSGARVIALGSSNESIQSASEENPEVEFQSTDFNDRTATNQLLETLGSRQIDILINNAGINKIDTVGEINITDWDNIQAVNVRAPFLLCRSLAPKMAERSYGRIINIASIFGHVTRAQRAAYTTSKAALIGFTKSLAVDYAKQNVLVNAVGPGFIDTELTRSILSPKEREKLTAQVPMRRLGSPEEIASLVTFLVSDNNTFVTGQHIIADGGFTVV